MDGCPLAPPGEYVWTIRARHDTALCQITLGLPYVWVSPDTSSFLAFVRAGFQKSSVCPGFGPIRKYIRKLPIAKAYDGMRQRKLVSFQYMSQ